MLDGRHADQRQDLARRGVEGLDDLRGRALDGPPADVPALLRGLHCGHVIGERSWRGVTLAANDGLALQLEDVDFAGREIRVAPGFSRGRLETPKSGIARTVDMSQQLARVLHRLNIDRTQEKLRRGWADMPPWVFCTTEGTPAIWHSCSGSSSGC